MGDALTHTNSIDPAGYPWTCVWQEHTGSWGQVKALSALTWAVVRAPLLAGMTLPSSPSPAAMRGSAQAPLCKTSRS